MSEVEKTFPSTTSQQVVHPVGRIRRVDKMLISAGVLVFLTSSAANVTLVVENHNLLGKVKILRSQQMTPQGVSLPPLSGVDQFGKPILVDFRNQTRPTVLFIFSPICSVCNKNWPRWNSILAAQKSLSWRPVFVNTGESVTTSYLNSHSLQQYTTFAQVSASTALTYRFFFTPETIILDGHGKVTSEWIGELSPEVTRTFSQSLSNSH